MEKRQLFLVITISLLCSTVFAASDSLWQKSVDAFAKNQNWVPGKIVSHFELSNGKGEKEEVTDSIKKISLAHDGSIHTELEKLIFNGEDKTEEAKARAAQEEEFSLKEAPLHPDNQSKITVTRTSTKMIDGVSCTGFEYTLDLGEKQKSGTLWIDSNGYPVQDDFTTLPLPPNVQKMHTRVVYAHQPDGTFFLSEMTYSGQGGMLFIKKSFQGKMNYSEHWQRPIQN